MELSSNIGKYRLFRYRKKKILEIQDIRDRRYTSIRQRDIEEIGKKKYRDTRTFNEYIELQ